jgi:hemerythrin-like domain-containing protein
MVPTRDVRLPAGSPQSCQFAAVDQLVAEHREIERLTDSLVRWSLIVSDDRADQRRDATRFIHVLRSFVADWHHAREDAILFHMLDAACPSHERGAVAVMLHEHLRLDSLVAELALLAATPKSWTSAERARVESAARRYADLQRLHIAKEESTVFPMARALLVGAARSETDLRFAAFACSEGDESLAVLRRLTGSLTSAHAEA